MKFYFSIRKMQPTTVTIIRKKAHKFGEKEKYVTKINSFMVFVEI